MVKDKDVKAQMEAAGGDIRELAEDTSDLLRSYGDIDYFEVDPTYGFDIDIMANGDPVMVSATFGPIADLGIGEGEVFVSVEGSTVKEKKFKESKIEPSIIGDMVLDVIN